MATLTEEIGKLIANRLLADRALFLPGIGSLSIKREVAHRLSPTTIQPPRRVVEFSSKPVGTSLVDEIAHAARCDEARAVDAYERWRDKSLKEGVLLIEGVGSLRHKHFEPAPEFEQLLNPQGSTPVRLRRPMPWWAWSAMTLTAIFLIFGALTLWVDPLPLWNSWQANRKGHETLQASTEKPAETPTPAENTTTGNSPAETQQTEETMTPATAAESSTATTTHEPETAESPAESANAISTPSSATSAASDTDALTRTRSGWSYVVLGIFSTETNGRRAIEQALRKPGIEAAQCHLYYYGDKFLVSLFESESRESAQAEAQRLRNESQVNDLWVYTKR